jgi:hypothetical protein
MSAQLFTSDRPSSNAERLATWRHGATLVGYEFVTGPRFMADFDRVFARQYEAEAIADSAQDLEDRP